MAWRSFLFRIFFDGYNGMLIRWPHVVAMGNALVFPLITSTVILRSGKQKRKRIVIIVFVSNKWAFFPGLISTTSVTSIHSLASTRTWFQRSYRAWNYVGISWQYDICWWRHASRYESSRELADIRELCHVCKCGDSRENPTQHWLLSNHWQRLKA